VDDEEFRIPGGARIRTNLPLAKAAMLHLGRSWPRAVSFEDLLTSAPDRKFLQHLLLNTYASGLVELHASPSSFSTEVSDRPRAFSLARFHARRGSIIPTLRHSTVEVQDQLARRLIELLDGTRDRQALLRDLGAPARPEDLDRNLAKLARMALLEGE
jgi:hypothetical protein